MRLAFCSYWKILFLPMPNDFMGETLFSLMSGFDEIADNLVFRRYGQAGVS